MRFVAKFFRRWYLYLIPIIVLPVLATMYGKQALTVYESSALIYINKPSAINGATTSFNQYLSPGQNGANAMNEALLSETFVVSVAKKTDLAKLYDLNSQYGQDAVTVRIRGEVSIAAADVISSTLMPSRDARTDISPFLSPWCAPWRMAVSEALFWPECVLECIAAHDGVLPPL